MERLPECVQARICKYLNATDLINVCEAIPCMKQVLKSATLRGTLRNYVRQMQWVDETLHVGLHFTIAKMRAETDGDSEVRTESEAEAETEAEVLCKAIRYYQEDYQCRAKCLNQNPPPDKMVLEFLLLGCVMSDLEDRLPFFETMRHWTDEDGQPLFEDCGVLCGSGRITLTMSNFRIHLDVYTEAPDWESTHLHLWLMALERYDGFVYLVNSTMHCHVRHRLPYYLKRLMQDITKIVCDGKRPLPALLILDLVIGQTCGDADSLATNLHALDDGILGGFTRLPARFWSCNWWRVWRLQQEDGKYVNLYEAFQWATLQLARNGTRKGKILHYSNVPAPSFIRWFE